ncbi:hypothetical protein TRFO_31451 [Tritrichomonas foetus]|uniref:Protein kinase domain-containing protein n=1 Tax=Tritrichomonas foetus TaxID=1144522 RepID=A0A1J4JRL1_9EUKA|nr:hypothetical protein TRFO_31451 [Tritrichomonas foetus]|eukprot:OHT01667.1 hypothetical protein TRFO_31451 [Tritrichomonas foetus]
MDAKILFSDVKKIGSGSFSSIYSAKHVQSDLPMCLKIFNRGVAHKQILAEIAALRNVKHPFIVGFYNLIRNFKIIEKGEVKYIIEDQQKSENSNQNQEDTNEMAKKATNEVANKQIPLGSLLANQNNGLAKKSQIKFRKSVDYSNSPQNIFHHTSGNSTNTENNNMNNKNNSIESIAIAMEYVKGISLLHFVNASIKLSEEVARRVFSQIINAVNYLHKNGFCHRDLKLENIMMDEYNNVRIIDFGFSHDGKNVLMTSQCGSYPYAAPELLMGRPYSKKVDIWALGVIIYAMVHGSLPFEDFNQSGLIRKICYMEPNINHMLSRELQDLILRMLDKNEESRITAEEIMNHPWLTQSNLDRNSNSKHLILEDDFAERFYQWAGSAVEETARIMKVSTEEVIETIKEQDHIHPTKSMQNLHEQIKELSQYTNNSLNQNNNINNSNNNNTGKNENFIIQGDDQSKNDSNCNKNNDNSNNLDDELICHARNRSHRDDNLARTSSRMSFCEMDLYGDSLYSEIGLVFNALTEKHKSRRLNSLLIILNNGEPLAAIKKEASAQLPHLGYSNKNTSLNNMIFTPRKPSEDTKSSFPLILQNPNLSLISNKTRVRLSLKHENASVIAHIVNQPVKMKRFKVNRNSVGCIVIPT